MPRSCISSTKRLLTASFNCKYHTSRPCNCTNIIFPIWSKLVQVAVLKKDYVIWLDVGQKAKTIRMTLPHPCKTLMSKVI